jgi:hypothetical protein
MMSPFAVIPRAAISGAVVIALLLGSGAAAAAGRFSGDAYSAAGNALLYHETQYLLAGGAERLVLYRCPDGRAFARKRVRESGNMQAPDFDLVDARLGYREGVRDRGAQREVYVQRRANMPEQADLLSVPADGVIDTGFDTFAQRHWDALLRGDTLRFPYLVPSRRTFYQFKVSRIDAGTARQTMTIRLAASNWLSFLLPHIDVTFDLASRRVVHYEGLSNIRGDDGKNYQVRADYPAVGNGLEVAQAEVDAALDTPLASSCTAADNTVSAGGQATVPEVTTSAQARNPNP